MTKVTINPNVQQPNECTDVSVLQVLKHFKNKDEHDIIKLRRETDSERQQQMKLELPVVIFGGTFKTRSTTGLVEASGFVCLDFDCDSLDESHKIKDQIDGDPYIFSYFLSTRGIGWKALVRIPKVDDDYEFLVYWSVINNYYDGIDKT